MDFVKGLPRSEILDTILVIVDQLNKYAHFSGVRHPFIAVSVAAIFIKEVVKPCGIPQSMISNCDRVFMNHFLHGLFKLQGMVLKRSTTYHP